MTWIGLRRERQEHELGQHLVEVLVHDSVHECGQARRSRQQHAVQEEGVVVDELDVVLVEVEVSVGVELVVGAVEPDLQQLHLLPPLTPLGA